jgi:DNA-binding response OmpR family regulator
MQAKQLARAHDETQPHTAGNTRTTILIVDDDTGARLTISAMISNDDYRVVPGTGAAEARERLPGADAVAAKPINAAELRAVVYAAVRMRRQYQNLIREDQAGS